MQALKDTIKEDKDGEKYGSLSLRGAASLDEYGRLSQVFKDELKELKEEELMRLEEAIKNARQPTPDIFGIQRRFCNVCEEGCIGYEPHTILFPSQQLNQFPTFCKNCKCPAHFH